VNLSKIVYSAVAFAALGLGSGTASAAGQISGSISLTGFFDCACFSVGSSSIVSSLVTIESLDPATSGAGIGDYVGSVGAVTPVEDILLDPMIPGYPGIQPVYTFVDGTEFFAVAALNVIRVGLSCTGTGCVDSLEFRLIGQVKRPGFLDTSGVVRRFGWRLHGGTHRLVVGEPVFAGAHSGARQPRPARSRLAGGRLRASSRARLTLRRSAADRPATVSPFGGRISGSSG
jgi:hypothetical protein